MSLNERFGRNRPNLRKVKLHEVPDVTMLQRLLSDLSTSAVGAECDVAWQSEGRFYTLTLTHSRQSVRAHWKLYRGQGAQPQLIWEHATNDVQVVARSIQAETEQNEKPSFAQKGRALLGTPERRAINLNSNLSSKLRHLFIDAQDNLVAGALSQSLPESASQSLRAKDVIEAVKAQELLEPTTPLEYVDLALGRELLQQLFINEHGVFSYPTFLFFLEREYYEAIENNSAITLVVFCAKDIASMPGYASTSPFLAPVFLEVSKRLKQTQRKTDILAQYEQNKFAVLLPDTSSNGGKSFVRRVQKALLRIEVEPGMGDNSLQCVFGLATLGEHCQTLPALLAFADKALETAQQLGSDLITDEDVLHEQGLSGYEYLSKSIDLAPTQHLVSQLVSGGIFTFPAFLAFLEREYYRSARKKRELVVLVFKIRVYEETFDAPDNMLPAPAFYEVIRRLGALLSKRDIFAHYGNGNFVILRSNTTAAQMENFARRAVQTIKSDDWLTPECPADSLRTFTEVCTVQQHPSVPGLLGLRTVDQSASSK